MWLMCCHQAQCMIGWLYRNKVVMWLFSAQLWPSWLTDSDGGVSLEGAERAASFPVMLDYGEGFSVLQETKKTEAQQYDRVCELEEIWSTLCVDSRCRHHGGCRRSCRRRTDGWSLSAATHGWSWDSQPADRQTGEQNLYRETDVVDVEQEKHRCK